MEIWRVMQRDVNEREWTHVADKIYKEKRHATSLMRHRGGRDAVWDNKEKVWVSPNGRWIFKIQKAEVGEWGDLIG